ncbi:class I SAM-dependent methyltransferase [Clostridium saccharoperbutylacetonicum]|uniref:class I SAM-dependent methyltransferase n=1 Tax=Clostridium saccharoperbutylacetonicum TaxID=36745 RepID=UPI000983D627|nr:class I SAM-dependent methyltransferase [Clostridium saccharoperbutylacetonicum]AQR96468.1 ubiquinone/menaquinone biosynthesis C-methyltransferase UbiE [Clostridium saccharoperbutylacetonicum]NSB32342.1 SAM-dependent methyltransferase [Clostridium saccharoperbutylacetonicum]
MNSKLNDITKQFYDSHIEVWPQNSRWYRYTIESINNYVYTEYTKMARKIKNPLILNAGSGGSTYKIKCDMWHVDISPKKIENFKHHKTCSIENMPFKDNTFDLCICVGSIINYCDPISAINELIRCIKPSGKLILEFESSVTGELFFDKLFGKNVSLFTSNYLNSSHSEWLYNPKYIIQILKKHDGKISNIRRFHLLSSMFLPLLGEEHAYILSKSDFIFNHIPFLNKISSNVIITFSKGC